MTRPGGGAWAQTIYWPLMQASTLGRGRSLLPQIASEKFDTKHYTDVPVVDAAAVMDDDGNVTIFAVNRDLMEDVELTCDLRSFGSFRQINHSVLHHDDVKATNTEDHPDTVLPHEIPAKLDGNPLVLPAASWNVIRLTRE